MDPLLIYVALIIWTFFGFWISYLAKKKMGEGVSEFFIGDRKISGFISGMTYTATTYSAFMMIGLIGLTYSSGVVALGFELTYLIFTIILLIIFAPLFWKASKRHDLVTPPDLLVKRYGNKHIGVVASLLGIVMLVPYASIQLMGAGYLFNGLSGGEIPYIVGVVFMAGFSGLSAYWAGFRSVSWTDAFQAITMFITSIALLFFVFYNFFGGPLDFFSTISTKTPQMLKINWGFKKFIGIALPWAFFAISNPQVSQRMFVSEDITSLKRMIIYFSIFGFIYTLITVLLGFSIKYIEPGLEVADQAMPFLLNQVPPILGLIAFLGIFAAATSTLGSILLTLSSLGTENIVKPIKPGLSERKRVLIGKITILCLLIICIAFAMLKLGLIAVLSSAASGGLLVSVPAFFGVFFWKNGTDQGAIWSIIIAGTITAVLYISGWYPFGWWPPIWGIVVSTIVYVGVSLFTEVPEEAEDFSSIKDF